LISSGDRPFSFRLSFPFSPLFMFFFPRLCQLRALPSGRGFFPHRFLPLAPLSLFPTLYVCLFPPPNLDFLEKSFVQPSFLIFSPPRSLSPYDLLRQPPPTPFVFGALSAILQLLLFPIWCLKYPPCLFPSVNFSPLFFLLASLFELAQASRRNLSFSRLGSVCR